jgi:hypothetical protein
LIAFSIIGLFQLGLAMASQSSGDGDTVGAWVGAALALIATNSEFNLMALLGVILLHHNLLAASAFAISFRTPYLWNGTTKKR